VQSRLDKGAPLPDWYLDEPERGQDGAFYLSAFWDLHTCRHMGFSPGPIPWNRIKEYADFVGLDRQNAFAFTAIIRLMDNAYTKWSDGERETAEKDAKSREGRRGEEQASRPH
jgi:hypothetical protein